MKHTLKKRPGFSPVMIIVILLVVIGLGVGGYFAYTKLILPGLNPYNQLIPESLKAYDVGKNADGFIVYKSDKDLEDLYNQTGVGTEANKVKALVGYYSSQGQSAALVVQLSSKDVADLVVKTINDQQSSMTGFSLFPKVNVEQKDDIIIVTIGQGLKAFAGPLSENPDISKIDKTMVDSQLIAYMNHAKSPESTLLLFSLSNTIFSSMSFSDISMSASELNATIPTAHAQGFISAGDNPAHISTAVGGTSGTISTAVGGTGSPRASAMTVFNGILSFASDTTFIVRYKNQSLNAQLTTNIFDKQNLSSSAVIKIAQLSGSSMSNEDLEKSYDTMIEGIDKVIPEIQKGLDSNLFKDFYKASDAKFTFDHKTLKITINIAESDMKKIISSIKIAQSGAPMRARNAARMADLNNIVVAVETYYSDNNLYPETSMCVDQMEELQKYFSKSKSPVDTLGKQTIGTHECASGYYYQTFPGKATGYILWSKLENNGGRTNETPETVDEKITDEKFLASLGKDKEGQYYIVNRVENILSANEVTSGTTTEPNPVVLTTTPVVSQEATSTTPPPVKVKRVKQ